MTLIDAYHNLANAIVIQAVVDWRKAQKRNDEAMVKSIERFFMSEYCEILSGLEAGYLLNRLRKTPGNYTPSGRPKKLPHGVKQKPHVITHERVYSKSLVYTEYGRVKGRPRKYSN